MRQHAVVTAASLYQSGTLTLQQAAEYAGLTPGKMRASLATQGIEVHDPEPERELVAAD